MIKVARFSVIGLLALLGACAHPITIIPKIETPASAAPMVQKSVAYLISNADKDRQVTTPGGGGDSVNYYPYRDLEGGMFQVLNSVYSRVTLIRAESDELSLSKNKVSMIFIPTITTTSFSTGLMTWPPTDFSVAIAYLVRDLSGKLLYKNSVVGIGRATFEEFVKDFGLAGKRATEDVLRKFKEQIQAAPELK